MFTRRAKPIRITGDPDKQRPDKGSSTVFLFIIFVPYGLSKTQIAM
jgi:hypothetical protein